MYRYIVSTDIVVQPFDHQISEKSIGEIKHVSSIESSLYVDSTNLLSNTLAFVGWFATSKIAGFTIKFFDIRWEQDDAHLDDEDNKILNDAIQREINSWYRENVVDDNLVWDWKVSIEYTKDRYTRVATKDLLDKTYEECEEYVLSYLEEVDVHNPLSIGIVPIERKMEKYIDFNLLQISLFD